MHIFRIGCLFFLCYLPLVNVFAIDEVFQNNILITKDSQESLYWKKKLIQSALHSIELSGSYCGGEVFDEFILLIEERLHNLPELDVYILSVSDMITLKNRKNIQRLKEKFSQRFHYRETKRRVEFFPRFKICENHEKILVVDEKYYMCGGSNVTDESFREIEEIRKITSPILIDRFIGSGMRDMDVLASGPLARNLRIEFYQLWAKWNRSEYIPPKIASKKCSIPEFDINNPRLISNVEMIFISGNPEMKESNKCVKMMHDLFECSLHTIFVANMVFDEKGLIAGLQKASKRNVQITVITNGNRYKDTSMGKRFIGMANRNNYPLFLQTITKFYEYSESGHIYHKKVTIIDDEITVVGSMNISSKSASCDDESMLVIYSKEVALEVRGILNEDIDRSIEVTAAEIESFRYGWNWLIGKMASILSKNKIN